MKPESSVKNNQRNISFDVSAIKPGLYLLIFENNKEIFTKKILIE